MPEHRLPVGKVFVKVTDEEKLFYLFSRKNSPEPVKHNHLELLGGKIDDKDKDFMAGTIRELNEEETTGFLAGKLTGQPSPRRVEINGKSHYIFEIQIELDEYKRLKHGQKESVGFELIPAARLKEKDFQRSLTPQTQRIFEALGLRV